MVDELPRSEAGDALLDVLRRPPDELHVLALVEASEPVGSLHVARPRLEFVERESLRQRLADHEELDVGEFVRRPAGGGAGEHDVLDVPWELGRDALRERAELRATVAHSSTSSPPSSQVRARSTFGPLGASRMVSS